MNEDNHYLTEDNEARELQNQKRMKSLLITEKTTVTPSLAKEYLSVAGSNRNLRDRLVDKYAAMMQAGQWLLTHQGIAFDMDGKLIDGQHRLHAIIKAGVPVEMLVSHNVQDHEEIKAMSVVDGGAARSVADQLSIGYGVKNPAKVAAAVASIAALILPEHSIRGLSAVQLMPMVQQYEDRISEVIHAMAGRFKPGMQSPVIGALALALKVHRNATQEFIDAIVSGVGLKAGSPALTFRNWLINKNWKANGSKERRAVIGGATLNAVLAFKNNEKMELVRPNREAVNYFAKASKADADVMRRTLNLVK